MVVEIVQEDINALAQEIELCSEVGLEEIFFKFSNEELFVVFSMEQASNLLTKLESLMTQDILRLRVTL